jgi:NAD(P)-dependent dehydrogenase (short-subunit alcohol dehydrogenase family)
VAALVTRRVLVTGCSSPRGIGHATVRALAALGHRVVATVRHHDNDDALRADFEGQVDVISMDVLDDASIRAALEQVDRALGGLDVVVNNAGYGLIGGIEQCGLDAARALFETNYFGTLALVRRVLPSMRAQASGHLISVSSMFVPTLGPMGIGHYIASKAALEKAFEALAEEVAPWGIRVTNVQPGPVDTELSRQWARPTDDPRPGLIDELYAWIGARPEIVLESPNAVGGAIAALIEGRDPPPAFQTSGPATAWVGRALRDPSRRSER